MKLREILFLSAFVSMTSMAIDKDWKGLSDPHEFGLGVMGGIGVFDGLVGPGFPVTIAKKVVDRGFASDLNNQVFIEGQGGPLFLRGGTAFQFGLHLRWDFVKDLDWTFYGLGGVGGVVTGSSLGNSTAFYPRFGMGAVWNVFEVFSLRAELSHEFTGLGVLFPL